MTIRKLSIWFLALRVLRHELLEREYRVVVWLLSDNHIDFLIAWNNHCLAFYTSSCPQRTILPTSRIRLLHCIAVRLS
jgi:hypothetical protein